MAISRKEEARALNADERELVEKSHHPEIQHLSDAELQELVKLMRDRRDKAQTDVFRRRREIRGKGVPRGAKPVTGDAGSRTKLAVLAMAMRRVNTEVERRQQLAASMQQIENSRRALAIKKKAQTKAADFNTRHAHSGMRAVESSKTKDLIRPMELGRQRKAGQVAQAKRDSRGHHAL
ncbi:hypothetical protein [Mesorhizobium sp. KR1-2]|uniref:hypothetical protein n=1 Tax=Mesorhizobium sp. KR1-2 TaxID=3156609 RepID=UPI0032B6107B